MTKQDKTSDIIYTLLLLGAVLMVGPFLWIVPHV
jgi:hypothetical protein